MELLKIKEVASDVLCLPLAPTTTASCSPKSNPCLIFVLKILIEL